MDVTISFAILIPVILGLVQVGKVSGLSVQWAPLASIFLGIVGAMALSSFTFSGAVIIQGIIAGLSASGLWSGTTTTLASV